MKNLNAILALSLLGIVMRNSFAQNPANVVGAGYLPSTPIAVAPGQIVTLFVTGLAPTGALPISAQTLPLPYKLAGISATLLFGTTVPIPILTVSSSNTCLLTVPSAGLQCGTVTGITLQIPFELPLDNGKLSPPTLIYLSISDDTGHSGTVRVFSAVDQIHVVGTGHLVVPAASGIVTHADGTAVDYAHPAKLGEEVVMYAFGLGQTSPAGKTGAASPSPAAQTTEAFRLNFDYRPNATASPVPVLSGSASGPRPLFAGLTPGLVGLYQINFVIPTPPGPLAPCIGPAYIGAGANPFNAVLSNLTVTLVGGSSFDGAGICVATGP